MMGLSSVPDSTASPQFEACVKVSVPKVGMQYICCHSEACGCACGHMQKSSVH